MAKKKHQIKVDLDEQAAEILRKATEKGIEHSYMFVTTYKRYQEHLLHLVALQEAIEKEGLTVTKEYVKGRGNLYINPAISAYNQTAGAADKTAQLLMKFIDQAPRDDGESGDSFDVF